MTKSKEKKRQRFSTTNMLLSFYSGIKQIKLLVVIVKHPRDYLSCPTPRNIVKRIITARLTVRVRQFTVSWSFFSYVRQTKIVPSILSFWTWSLWILIRWKQGLSIIFPRSSGGPLLVNREIALWLLKVFISGQFAATAGIFFKFAETCFGCPFNNWGHWILLRQYLWGVSW